LNRGGAISGLYDKKILVVGCGSIGGYLIGELVKTGINNLTIVDDDLLKEENVYRHLLGMEYINNYKTKSLADYINKNIPKVNMQSFESSIEDAISDGAITFSNYDLIISAVGNHNVNRWINEYIYLNGIKTPVVYLWNEVLGIGNHVAFISTDYDGCYECFFGVSEESIYDKTSYCERGQVFTKTIRGCGSSFMPYSSLTSLISVTTGIEVIRNLFEGRIKNNFILSVKGDDFYFKNAGLVTSNKYNQQFDSKVLIEGEKFKREGCMSCGNK
jgi:molybdopterin/thiamine biosynthesis adenylyltransferase